MIDRTTINETQAYPASADRATDASNAELQTVTELTLYQFSDLNKHLRYENVPPRLGMCSRVRDIGCCLTKN
jgi:hypothetical protein